MQVGNNSAIKQSVAAGLGIALISHVAIEMELETNRLVVLDVEGFPLMRQMVACPPERKKPLRHCSRL